MVDKLKCWDRGDKDKAEALLYRVKVEVAGESERVTIVYPDGTRDHSNTANRIINLLYTQLK